tara:strand:+ start:3425 stop:3931 length:507 start_codon:yes stop_codon:yes gene_type:complete
MSTEQKLQAAIDRFIGEVTDLIQEAAIETVHAAISGAVASPRRASAAPKKTTRKKAARKTASRKAGGKRIRRSAADLRDTANAILAFIKSNDGCAMSDISAAMGEEPIKLRPAIQILLEENSAHTTGAKRGTKYHPGGKRGGGAKKAATKAKRKPAGRKKAARKAKRR